MQTTQTHYYHEGIKKAVAIFGSRFNGMQIKRYSDASTVDHTIDVPITYSPIQKYLARIKADADANRKVSIRYPVMSFEITDISRRDDRSVTPSQKIRYTDGKTHFVPVPYDIGFQLNIISNRSEDTLQLVEQILPMFAPKMAISANLLDNIDQEWSIPLIMTNVSMTDSYDGDFITRRAIIWQINFVMQYYFFGPVSTPALIKFVKTNIYSDENMTQLDQEMVGKPGLTANGEPTTTSNNSIDYSLINSDDNYGFIFEITEKPDANT